ncbi:MAG: STAS domain-containing protein [Bacteroidetes bacterium]|nr:STAS domain-containing protein [Bacteroidota bacterium]
MRYTLDHEDNSATMTVHEERLDITNSSNFKAEVLLHTRSGIEIFFIDLSEVVYCDSTGLGALLLAHREMKAAGGATIFIGLSDRLRSFINVSQLDRVLYIYDTREEALADLQSDDEADHDDLGEEM